MKLNILTKSQETKICLSCGECCKRYNITLLPREVLVLAKKLKISKKNFLENNCELFVKVFPKTIPGILTCPTTFFPKKIGDLLYNEFNYVPAGFFIVPQITLKRKENGCCEFLNDDNSCQVYKERPTPCKLFPFLVAPGYEENYPFCELFHKTYKNYSKESRKFQKEISSYFKDVDEKGFEKVWKYLPKKGKFFLNDSLLGEITDKQILKMLSKRIKRPKKY